MPYTGRQLARLRRGARRPARRSTASPSTPPTRRAPWPTRHARRSFVRAGIAVYGVSPGPGVDELAAGLRPVLSLKARVSFVKRLAAGSRLSYGLRHQLAADANVATVPLGYADGVRRGLSSNGDVLIGGRRRPIIGTITMDQLMVDCGDDPVAARRRGRPARTRRATSRSRPRSGPTRLGTIGYEVLCGIGPRVPRHVASRPAPSVTSSRHVADPAPARPVARRHARDRRRAGRAQPAPATSSCWRGRWAAGKTAFAQGFGHALGVGEPITSPTFTLVHSYDTAGSRCTTPTCTGSISSPRSPTSPCSSSPRIDGIVLVEWGDVVESTFGEHLIVRLELVDGEPDARRVTISAVGPTWARRWAALVRRHIGAVPR